MLTSCIVITDLLCMLAAGGEHAALHQCQSVRSVRAHPDGASAAESLSTGPKLHRGATAHGGREREAGPLHSF